MTDSGLAELFKALGVAMPLVGIMFYLLRDSQKERRENDAAWRVAVESQRKEFEAKLDAMEARILAAVAAHGRGG